MRVWPFVGREAELSLIRSAFLGSDVNAVVLTAPAGLGKTRLARQVLSGLDGVRTEWVGATRAAAGIPFAAVAALLPDDAPPGGLVEMMRAAGRYLHGWGGRRRVAVGVDDAHLLDDASATLVAHLVTEHAAFVIMTMRSGETVADALAGLCKDGHADLVELQPLPDAAIETLIDHAAAGSPDARQRRRLHQIACGNPLALHELLHGPQPGGLTDLVMAKLDSLKPAIRRVVELVACGEPLAVSIVERIAGLPALQAAEDSGLVVVERSGGRVRARLNHPIYGEVLRSRLPLSRARQAYRALAGALLETPLRRRDDTLVASVWQVEAGEISRPEVVRAGAWQAVGNADLQLAERLARATRAAAPGAEADRLLGEILAYQGRVAEAAQVRPAAPPPDPPARTGWATTRAKVLYWGSGDTDAVWAALDTAAGQDAVEAARSWLYFFDARCTDSARLAGQLLSNTTAEPRSLIRAAAAGSAANGFLGRLHEATQIHRRGVAIAVAHADTVPWGLVEVDTGMCLAQLACGQVTAAQAIAAAGYHAAVDRGATLIVSAWALCGGLAAVARGHLDDADRLLTEALAGFQANDIFRLTRCCLAARAAVAALGGDPAAPALLAEADALAHPANRIFEPWVETWRARVAYAGGDLPAAIAAAARAADLARDAAMPGVEALARYDLPRLGGQPDSDRLDTIDDDLGRLAAGAARALTARDEAAMLQAVAREFETRGYDLHAAEAYTAAAHRHHRHGRTTQANLASANADRLRVAFPTARTLLLRTGHLASLLTRREREVMFLAVDYTSAQIADRLQLAVSTVNNNLARAYGKLGITGRAQLRALLNGANTRVEKHSR